ncbi:MAG: 3-isopropylmalate dehydratase large subunit [Chloroflexi bacterium]|nr:3-isopropylmalate dehydratase large subunit [Chloroflexota bacterium]
MSQTISERIISKHANQAVSAGDIAIVDVDAVMATDATAPFAIKAFKEMGGEKVWNKEKVFLVIDHASPAPNERVANLHKLMRNFAKEQGIKLYDVGAGICHQLMVENAHVRPGDLFLGADSHTPTYGSLGSFAVGVGSTDLAGVLLTGKTWLKVPKSILINIEGEIPAGVSAKDIILFLVEKMGAEGAVYEAIELSGSAVESMTLASRMVLSNMVAEMGAKAGLVNTKGLKLDYPFEHQLVDPNANYREIFTYDISNIRPQIAQPHAPDNVLPIDKIIGKKVDAAFIGSCTNSRLEDLHIAAEILRGRKVAVRLLIAPASKAIFDTALQDGTIQTLTEAGATFITSGCGPCVGTHLGVPGDDEVVISSTNRNFQGRMGNPRAGVFLASPAVVAAAAVAGEIIDPEKL